MPRKGYQSITVHQALYDALDDDAKRKGLTVPELLERLLAMIRGASVPIGVHHKGPVYDTHYYVEVTQHDYRVVRLASHYYQKDPKEIVQKFITHF